MKVLSFPSRPTVEAFLRRIDLERYTSTFLDNDIDETILPQLTDADLRELGIGSLGYRKRLLAAIATLGAEDKPIAATNASPNLNVPTGERRQLAVLFADLCGYTALSRSIDPEELHEIVSHYTKLIDQIIIDYDGTVNQHVGDGIMALFGAPRAHDNDVVRAARRTENIGKSGGRRLHNLCSSPSLSGGWRGVSVPSH